MKNLIVSFLVLLQIGFPYPVFAQESPAPSVIVLSVTDGDLDVETQEIAQALRHLWDTETHLKLISEEDLTAVFNYYRDGVSHSETISDSERRLIQAKEQYHKANIKEAKRLVGLLISDLEQKKDLGSEGKFLQEAHLLRAICVWASRDKKAVENDFEKILVLNPLFKLDADLFPPLFSLSNRINVAAQIVTVRLASKPI